MKKKSFYKDLFRSIYKTKARFLSILSIIALGVGFFAGINATEPDMLLSADTYYKNNNLSDFRIISPLGFTESDTINIKEIAGVDRVQPGYSKDLFLTSKEGNTLTLKLFSYDKNDYSDNDGLNIPIIIEGRMPDKSGEIAIDYGNGIPSDMKIGSLVTLSLPDEEDKNDFLKSYTYTVVGFINSPMYIDYERGQTNIGDGSIDLFAYITKDDFKMERITDLFVRTTNSKNLIAYSNNYNDHLSPLQTSFESLGAEAIGNETQSLRDELNNGKEEFTSNKQKADKELAEAEKKLRDSEKEIADGENKLNETEETYTKEFREQREQLSKGKEELELGRTLYSENYAKWLDGYNLYMNSKSELDRTKTELDAAKAQISQSEKELEVILSMIQDTSPDTNPEYNTMLAKYEAGVKLFEENKAKYEKGLEAYNQGVARLTESKILVDNGKIELDRAKAALEENERKITQGEAALSKGKEDLKNSLSKGRKSLAEAKIELSKGRETYEKEKALAIEEISNAEDKIKDAERQLIEIPDNWFVLTRESNPGYSGYGDDANRIGAVAKVFPLFFFLVAALVCLTTMTRMIDEERTQIGTLKSLGYSILTISSKYLVYSLLASFIGTFLGLVVGFRLFPEVIMNAYGIMYKIPVRLTPFHMNYALISLLFAVATIVSAALLATLQELRSTTAVLIQPKAPTPGKRIFLERITPIWRRLSFSHKVTARNIFRYKRRLLMTVIGIAGCTALLVTGFGLRDSINDIMNKQFKEIFIYDAQVMVDTEDKTAALDVQNILRDQNEVKSNIRTLNETVNVLSSSSGRTYKTNLIVPESLNNFDNFFALHKRKSKDEIQLTSSGAVITEKLSNLLGVGVGDTLSYMDSENNTYDIKITAITENYLTHYIYMSPEYFDKITLKDPVYNSMLINFEDVDSIDEKAFKEELLSNDDVLGVMFLKSLENNFEDTMNSLDYVVLVLILSAGLLAFIVLYNLTNINITERIREIATIKVLGFRENEVNAYVYRENVILTVIGTLAGLLLGLVLHRFVIDTMEIDTMMFGREVHVLSFVLSIVFTMLFLIFVNFFMRFKLRNVNMVESLKSVD